MKLADILASLFPDGHAITSRNGLIFGDAPLQPGSDVYVIGVDGRTAVGVDEALLLAGKVLDAYRTGRYRALLVLVDSDSQRMRRRDEMLGLHEFLAHLAKCLLVVDAMGLPTVGLLYGYTAAGAFIATALATRALFALPGAHPAVMDLPSMSRVTKLPIAVLQEKAASTPVFAPGLNNLSQTGAVSATLDPAQSLNQQVLAALATLSQPDLVPEMIRDPRDELGLQRGGRPKAMHIAERVRKLAYASGHE
jgi:malonate decarboxylase gamma subunit